MDNLNSSESNINIKSYKPNLHLVESDVITSTSNIENTNSDSNMINLTTLSNSMNQYNIKNNTTTNDKLNILPVDKLEEKQLAEEHSAEPIKSIEDIKKIIQYFLDHKMYRNVMLFIVGIHTGLRISDILELRFSDFINADCTFKDEQDDLVVFEKKTQNTRKIKKNRHMPIHNDIKKIITIYLNHKSNVTLNDYLFRSESNNGSKTNKPISREAADAMLKDIIVKRLHINIRHCSTHTLRKTFAFHSIMQAKDKTRAIQQLQLLLGHSSQLCTLKYAGITDDELAQTYKDLYFNLDDVL